MNLPMDDGQLLRRCGRGDERALGELISRYEQRLYRVAFRVVGDRALAEEAAVDSFYKIWRKAGQWRGKTGAEAWILRIAVRTTLDLKRGRERWWRRKRLASSETDRDPARGPVDLLIADEEQQHASRELHRAIGLLKEEDQILVHLFYFEEQGLAEIAEILDASRDALKMRLARSRKRLRQVLEEATDGSET